MTEQSISESASMLGKQGRGRKKTLSAEERERRVKAAAWARKFRKNRKGENEHT